MSSQNPKIFNCHTHIFKSENVPPYLAKKFLPFPLYYLINTNAIICFAKFWFKNRKYSPYFLRKKSWYKKLLAIKTNYLWFVKNTLLVKWVVSVLNMWLTMHVIYYIFKTPILAAISKSDKILEVVRGVLNWLIFHKLFYPNLNFLLKVILILFVFLFIKSGRQLIISLGRRLVKAFRLIPNKQTLEFFNRYLNIGRFAIYTNSTDIFDRLKDQYPKNETGFILLPMDMDYMGSGKVSINGNYYSQLQELAEVKRNNPNSVFPFVFIDPRRIKEDSTFLKIEWNEDTAKIVLGDCMVRKYIVDNKFSGFKIYPALGYYPFDEELLMLWLYAKQNNLPIMTHTIRGNIFYRGNKEKDWNYHPFFKQNDGGGKISPLLLPEQKNIDFINNFTHPLNFLCLLDEKMLSKVIATCSAKVKNCFGYEETTGTIKQNLTELKICFGHYGGDDEWVKYLENDRNNYAMSINTHPNRGIDFFKNVDGLYVETKIEEIWRDIDWYSICTSIMLQYPNVYADISYIIHNDSIYPLLKCSLSNTVLQRKILFGTDFYVVRNHKSEKQMLCELKLHLSDETFILLTNTNPTNYLTSNFMSI